MTGAAIDVRGLDGSPVDGAALADGLVSAVCRPTDVPVVRAAVLDADPGDLAALVATVDQHQPMALEVVVDVLAELGVAPSAVAEAMAVEEADVVAMLGGPLGDAPAPRADADARIIEVAASEPEERAGPDVLDRSRSADPSPEAIPEPPGETSHEPSHQPGQGPEGPGSRGVPADTEDPSDVRDASSPARAVTVRIDEVAEAEEVARTVADLEGEVAGVGRSRVVWAVLLFLLVAGGVVAAAVVWWWP